MRDILHRLANVIRGIGLLTIIGGTASGYFITTDYDEKQFQVRLLLFGISAAFGCALYVVGYILDGQWDFKPLNPILEKQPTRPHEEIRHLIDYDKLYSPENDDYWRDK